MKIKLVIVAIIILAAAACTQKTCPTYSKQDSKDLNPTEERI